MRGIGQVLLVVGSAIDALFLIPIGLANLLVTGDLMPAQVVGTWPLPTGVLIAIVGMAGVRWDRAAAGAAALAVLPLILAVSLASTGIAALAVAGLLGVGSVLTILGAALRLRDGASR